MSERTLTFIDTTIGKKVVMAVSGVVLLGFVLGHMLGNIQIFAGRETLDAYAAFLHSLGGGLWAARVVLLAAVGAHIWAAISLVQANKAARPVGYKMKKDAATTYAAKMMPIGGMVVLFFILYHLAHMTLGVVGPYPNGEYVQANVYDNLVTGFQNPAVSGVYIVANVFLGLHLYHGAWSFMQTLGLAHPRLNPKRKQFATAFAVIVAGGNILIPLAVLGGLVKL
jgi:succinate dehydrogenase / fumarate reductase cytochrome b subunit